MATYMKPQFIYKGNGRINPLGEDRYIRDDRDDIMRMPSNHDIYEDASFYMQQRQSFDSETNDSDPPYRKAPCKESKSQVSLTCPEDGADVPLLNGIDGFNNYPAAEPVNYCREPMPVTNSLAWRKLVAATTMCLIFMVIELVGGYFAGSLAIMTDAAHLLSDCVGFLVGLFAVWISGQPATHRFTYGYHRAEVLGALLSISVIWILTGIFVYLAVERLVKGDFDIHADAMMIVAFIGIGINIVMGCILHTSSPHHYGHAHQEENINVKAAVVHVLGDLIQSTGVFISALIIKLYPNAKVIDPVCTFLCCLLVMCSTIPVLRQSVWVLLECLPPGLDYNQLHSALSCVDGVQDVHALHVWALTPGHYVASVHLAVGGMTDRDEVLKKAQWLLHNKFHLERTTIQVERHLSDMIAQ